MAQVPSDPVPEPGQPRQQAETEGHLRVQAMTAEEAEEAREETESAVLMQVPAVQVETAPQVVGREKQQALRELPVRGRGPQLRLTAAPTLPTQPVVYSWVPEVQAVEEEPEAEMEMTATVETVARVEPEARAVESS